MKKSHDSILVAALFTCLASAAWADLTLNNSISNDPLGDIMIRINDVACIFLTFLTYVASGISVIIIMYAGVKYMTSQDAEQTTNAKNMIIYAIAGLALIILACPVVDYLVIGTKIVPFQQKCNCFGSIDGGSNGTAPPLQTCNDGTPAGNCSANPLYLGYKCFLVGSSLTLVLDSSCGSPVGSTTTTTTTTSSITTTSTTLTDHAFCYNAGEDATICAGLNVLRPGYQADCCTEWTCCCITPSGTCTAP
jgi:hypothetical protein